MAKATEAQKREFIAKVQHALETCHMDYDKKKYKNVITLSELGLTYKNVKAYVHDLTCEDYDDGPTIDYTHPQEDLYWVFKITIQKEKIYIRLKVREKDDGKVYVASFHYDDKTHYWGF